MRKYYLFVVFALIATLLSCNDERQSPSDHLQAFHLSSVKITDGPFKHASETNVEYVMSHDVDRLLAPFLKEAGLEPKAESYGNWENTGLDGHTAGHYLTSLSLIAASEDLPEASERLNYMIDELAGCQQANGRGYVGGIPGGYQMWEEVAKGDIRAGGFSLNNKWVPIYNIHKLFAGLIDAWTYTGNEKAREVLIGLSDYFLTVFGNLTDEQVQTMLASEHGGINEAFADVYSITGEEKYLRLAERLSHRAILDPLLQHEDKLSGLHANTQIPKVIGFMKVAAIEGDSALHDASRFFWQTVVNNRSITIGGNSTYEHFHPSDDFSSMIESRQGPETCNTYNMMKLSKLLYQNEGELQYIDYYERAMYNHILSSQHPGHGGLVYFTPMRPQHYRVYSNPGETFWCCVGSGIENHAKYGELIYAHDSVNLYLNLFVASELDWEEKGLKVTQTTNFPESGETTLKLGLEQASEFTLFIRHPEWNDRAPLSVKVNGKKYRSESSPGEYLPITRKWSDGDVVEIKFDLYNYGELLPDQSPYISLLHGPIVLAAANGSEGLEGLVADGSRMGHVADGPLLSRENAPVLVKTGDAWAEQISPLEGQPLTFLAKGLFRPEPEGGLELIPFYRLHDSRYTVYWQVATAEEYEEAQAALKRSEEELLALEALTIDQVETGQQQPESDHNFKASNSETGVHQNRHWRHARGWFSYELNDSAKEAAVLRVTYYGEDAGRNFDILLNGQVLATVNLDGSKADVFFDVDYPIPSELVKNNPKDKLELVFRAHPNSIAGGVYHVRLLRAE